VKKRSDRLAIIFAKIVLEGARGPGRGKDGAAGGARGLRAGVVDGVDFVDGVD